VSPPPARPSDGAAEPGWWRDLAGAWIFYSVLPAWPRPRPSFRRIARFAPLIGLLIGGAEALLWQITAGAWPVEARTAGVICLGLVLTGGMHADGLMDTADGLAAGPEQRLRAMDDSRVGAFGVLALVQVILLRAAALITLSARAPAALVAAAAWARCAPLPAMAWFPYLREGGTAAFHRAHWQGLARESRPAASVLAIALVAMATGWLPWWLLLGAPPALLVPLLLGRRLGGHSGDSYGACVEGSESLGLLLMAAGSLLG
jgi:adenosylcobinamide-GDP ribazoletransferase